jgi:hypothetical protein
MPENKNGWLEKHLWGAVESFIALCGLVFTVWAHFHPYSLPTVQESAKVATDAGVSMRLPLPLTVILVVLFLSVILHNAWAFFRKNKALPSKLVIDRSVYDVVSDCSMGDDPAGPWKYGYSKGVGNGFNPFKARQSDALAGVDRWFCPEIHEHLGVMHNRTNHTVPGEPFTYSIPANMMHMHPGIGGYCAVIRWQCPEDGTYTIQGSCAGLDIYPNADAEVHIMKNSRDLWHTTVGRVPSVETFPLPLREHFVSGDKLDFVVSQGVNWGSDSVGLQATVRKV